MGAIHAILSNVLHQVRYESTKIFHLMTDGYPVDTVIENHKIWLFLWTGALTVPGAWLIVENHGNNIHLSQPVVFSGFLIKLNG